MVSFGGFWGGLCILMCSVPFSRPDSMFGKDWVSGLLPDHAT